MARKRKSSEVQERKYSISALALTMQIPICRWEGVSIEK